jgi:hypothetical protein
LSGVGFVLTVQPCGKLHCSATGFLKFCPFDVARVTLLVKVKSLVANFAKWFGQWMSESDRDVDQFTTILFGNDDHRICVL